VCVCVYQGVGGGGLYLIECYYLQTTSYTESVVE
jgi:hypothetical protein